MTNLRKIREEKGVSQAAVAKELGISRQAYNNYELGKREADYETLLKLAEYFETTVEALIADVNVKKIPAAAKCHSVEPNPNLTLETPYHIPIFNSVSAGFGAYASSDIVGYMPMVIANPHDFKDTICIKVKGDSMYPKIEDGDVITVRKQASVDNGQIAVVRIGDECVVKKVELGKNFLKMVSINPEYKDRILTGPELEGVEIVGLVQQVTKKL